MRILLLFINRRDIYSRKVWLLPFVLTVFGVVFYLFTLRCVSKLATFIPQWIDNWVVVVDARGRISAWKGQTVTVESIFSRWCRGVSVVIILRSILFRILVAWSRSQTIMFACILTLLSGLWRSDNLANYCMRAIRTQVIFLAAAGWVIMIALVVIIAILMMIKIYVSRVVIKDCFIFSVSFHIFPCTFTIWALSRS